MTRLDPALWQEARPFLDQVLDAPAEERPGILARIAAGLPEVAHLVEQLLAADDARQPTLDVGLDEVLEDRPSVRGQRVGPWILERLLGEGGMGAVWLGRRSDGAFEGAAAIKLLHLGALGPGRAERFRREATLLARLDHPGIARLLDAGVTPAAQPYLVLEHVAGVRLDRFCADGRLGLEQRLRLFLQVCGAVGAAHASLVVHRDIKPANVLVTPDGRAKLLDFGIARLVEEGAEEAGARTTLSLTPEFAAPEQVREAPVTTAVDIYALGLLLHLMLTGRHPTGYDSLTPADFLRTTLERDPMRPGDAVLPSPSWPEDAAARHAATLGLSPAGLRRLLRGDLDVIVARALRKEPAERYPSVAELAADLERHLAHEPVRARPESRAYLARKYLRRHRVLLTAAGLVTASLLGATWVTTRQMLEAERQRDAARVERDRAAFESRRAEASSGFMQALLATMGPSGEKLGTVELLDRGRALLESDYGSDPRFVSRMLVELAGQYEALGDISGRGTALERAVVFASRSGDPDAEAFAECSLAQYIAMVLSGRVPEARTRLERASARPLAEPRTRARCLLAAARLAGHEGRPDSALVLAESAAAEVRRSADTSSVAWVSVLGELAFHLRGNGRIRDALVATRRMVTTLERIGRGSTLQTLQARREEVLHLDNLGERREGDSVRSVWLRDAVGLGSRMAAWVELERLWRAEFLQDHGTAIAIGQGRVARHRAAGDRAGVRTSLIALVPDLIAAGLVAEAGSALAEARQLSLPEDSTRILLLEGRLAAARGDHEGARRAYGRGLAAVGFPPTAMAAPGANPVFHFYRGYVLSAARAALLGGDPLAGDSLGRHYLRILAEIGQDPARSGEFGRGFLHQGQVRLALGDSAGARREVRRAIAALREGMGPDHPVTREAMELADALTHRRAGAPAD